MDIFDTHAHLLDERFNEDREALIASLPAHQVTLVMEACVNRAYLAKMIPFVEAHPSIYGSAGLHPEELSGCTLQDIDAVEAALAHPKIKAVGEIGLDYHWPDNPPREQQRQFFAQQVALAVAHKKPILVHDRDAHGDTLDVLKAHKNGLQGVMHCFSGSYETAKACLDLGLFIAFGGAVTFKNARKNVEVAQQIPLDRLLLETDCPYMAPVPFRGTRNDPTKSLYTLQTLADVRNMEVEELAACLFVNGKRLFSID